MVAHILTWAPVTQVETCMKFQVTDSGLAVADMWRSKSVDRNSFPFCLSNQMRINNNNNEKVLTSKCSEDSMKS